MDKRGMVRLGLRWLLVASCSVAALSVSWQPTSATVATTYKALTGAWENPGIAVNVFAPNLFIVNEGDAVEWTNPSEEPHIVTFPGPTALPEDFNPFEPVGGTSAIVDGTALVSSGEIAQNARYLVRFLKAGSYPFLCYIHPGMTGTVNVVASGMHVPSQAQLDAEGKRTLEPALARGRQMVAALPKTAASTRSGVSNNWIIPNSPVESLPNGSVLLNSFAPERITIEAGDTVTWLNDTPQPHSVTFLAGGTYGPSRRIVKAPGGMYDGTSYVNSGQMGDFPGLNGGTRFSLTFPKPGTYPYICILHIDSGMAGVIEVVGSSSAG